MITTDILSSASIAWRPVKSAWIQAIAQTLLPQGTAPDGYLFVHLKTKDGKTISKLLPEWAYEVVMRAADTGKSVGKAYHAVKSFAILED